MGPDPCPLVLPEILVVAHSERDPQRQGPLDRGDVHIARKALVLQSHRPLGVRGVG